jgi:hypothetical protein
VTGLERLALASGRDVGYVLPVKWNAGIFAVIVASILGVDLRLVRAEGA